MEATSEIAKAFVAAQKEFNPAVANAKNTFYKDNKGKPSSYVDLTGCYQAIMDSLHKNCFEECQLFEIYFRYY